MKRFISTLLLVSALTSTATADVEALASTRGQSKALIAIVERLSSTHYDPARIDDELSVAMLENYLDYLDPAKSYFLQSDIDGFQAWSKQFDDMVKQGDLTAVFAIYNRYRDRAFSRWEKNLALLEGDHSFDFDADEEIDTDNDNRDWPASMEDADRYWHKVVKDALLRLLLTEKPIDKAREVLAKRYHGLVSQLEQRDAEDAFAIFVNSFAQLYGPHTSYMPPRSVENFQIAMSLSLEGIGAVLQLEDEYTKVVSIVPRGPADKSDALHPGDKITAVAQGDKELVDVVGWRLDDVVKLIRGSKGSTVRLQVIPAKGDATLSKVITIVRDKIKLEEQAAQSKIIEVDDSNGETQRFGVIEIPTFYADMDDCRVNYPNCKTTTTDTRRLLDELVAQDVDGIILDLRNNGGGYLHEATALTDLFIHPGPIVQIRTAERRISRQHRARDDAYYEGPLFVLINRLSASASEIFAAAIQDYGRGVVIGSQSFGKGTVQSTHPIHDGLLKLTQSKFYRVSGGSTQNRGVLPDIELPSRYDPDDVGESSQPRAMPWDQISPAYHRQYQKNYHVPQLQLLSNQRRSSNPDLAHMVKELDLYRQRREQTVLSLNLQTRQAQQSSFEKALLELENQRRASKGLPELASYKDWVEEADASSDDDKASNDDTPDGQNEASDKPDDDPILYETGRVFADYLSLPQATAPVLAEHSDQ